MNSREAAGSDSLDLGDAINAIHRSGEEDEGERINFVSNEGLSTEPGVTEKRSRIAVLEEAVASIKAGQITADEFVAIVKKLEKVASILEKLYEIPAIKKGLPEKLTEYQLEIWNAFNVEILEVKKGAAMLINYVTSNDLGDLHNGLEITVKALQTSIGLQKKADIEHAAILEREREEKERRAAAAAAEEGQA